MQDIVQLFVRWLGSKTEPHKREVFIVADDSVEMLRSVPADRGRLVIGHQYDVCPAVHVCYHFECLRDSGMRPGNTHRRVKGHVIIQNNVTARFREEREVPVGHEVTSSYTYYTHTYNQSVYTAFQTNLTRVIGLFSNENQSILRLLLHYIRAFLTWPKYKPQGPRRKTKAK